MLTLSWCDGNTLIPINSCLLASAKGSNVIEQVRDFDKRTVAGKRRVLAQSKAPEAMLTLLDTAVSCGLSADYVLFDCWLANPAQITAIKSRNMDVIAMIKKSSRSDRAAAFTADLEKRLPEYLQKALHPAAVSA